jgi:hypothetical protein
MCCCQVYDVTVDTMLLAFCEDCESHNERPRCAPALLLKAIGEADEANRLEKERRERRRSGAKVASASEDPSTTAEAGQKTDGLQKSPQGKAVSLKVTIP